MVNTTYNKFDLPPAMTWEYAIPLATNRFILFDTFKILSISYAFIVLLFSLIGLFSGKPTLGLQMAYVFLFVVFGLGVAILLIMLIFYGNRMLVAFTLSPKGVTTRILSRRSKLANRAGIVVGFLSATPTLAGSSLLAQTRETTFYPWQNLHKTRFYPQEHTITLFTSWRSVARLHASTQHYAQIEAYVQQGLAYGAQQRAALKS